MPPSKLTIKDLGELKQQEIDLIYLIRRVYRFGEVTILTRDGVPQDILKTIQRIRLGNINPETDYGSETKMVSKK